MADTPRVTVPVEPRAHIVWNAARSEAVVFVDQEDGPSAWPLTAADNAHQASTGRSRSPGLGSALAEAFYEAYEDDDERPIQSVPLSMLSAAPAPEGGAVSPGGWLIREADGGWLWTGARITATAALTEGLEVVSLSALATREEPPAEAGEISAAFQRVNAVAVGGDVTDVYGAESFAHPNHTFRGDLRAILSALRAQPHAREGAQQVAGLTGAEKLALKDLALSGGETWLSRTQQAALDKVVAAFDTHPAPDALRVAVEALEPFAAEAQRIRAPQSAETIMDNVELWQCGSVNITRTRLTYGDLRKATQALAVLQAEQKGGAA